MKVHISTADLPFLEASYIDTTGMAHIKIVDASKRSDWAK